MAFHSTQKGVIQDHGRDEYVYGVGMAGARRSGMMVEAKTVSADILARKTGRPANVFTDGPFPVTGQRLDEDGSVEVQVRVARGVLSVPMTFAEYNALPEMDFPGEDSPIWGARMKR